MQEGWGFPSSLMTFFLNLNLGKIHKQVKLTNIYI